LAHQLVSNYLINYNNVNELYVFVMSFIMIINFIVLKGGFR